MAARGRAWQAEQAERAVQAPPPDDADPGKKAARLARADPLALEGFARQYGLDLDLRRVWPPSNQAGPPRSPPGSPLPDGKRQCLQQQRPDDGVVDAAAP